MSEAECEAMIEQMKAIGEQFWLAIDYAEHGDLDSASTLWNTAAKSVPSVKIKLSLATQYIIKEEIM